MRPEGTASGGEGLARSCGTGGPDWIRSTGPIGGVELFQAWFAGAAYETHRHDTYAIGLTDCGVQVFGYRGAQRSSTAGQVVALYPDEAHDGRAGTAEGFGYRIVYVEPSCLADALRVLRGRPSPLPFVREVVSANARLSRAIRGAFHTRLEPLAVDSLVLDLAEGLAEGAGGAARPASSRSADVRALERARQFLEAEKTRVVHSSELEAATGLTRYELARQFRVLFGTSPHRYLLMRRLDFARQLIRLGRPLADVALEAGFADQAHFTRAFKSGSGLTPAVYRSLSAPTA